MTRDITVRASTNGREVVIENELDTFYNIFMTPDEARGLAHLLEVKAREVEQRLGRIGRAASDYKLTAKAARERRENKGEASDSVGEVRTDSDGGPSEGGGV